MSDEKHMFDELTLIVKRLDERISRLEAASAAKPAQPVPLSASCSADTPNNEAVSSPHSADISGFAAALIEWLKAEMDEDELAKINARDHGEWSRYNFLEGHRSALLHVIHHIRAEQQRMLPRSGEQACPPNDQAQARPLESDRDRSK